MKLRAVAAAVAVLALATMPVVAAPTSDVSGKVEDDQGNPIEGATVTVVSLADEKLVFPMQSDKKGRFAFAGMTYFQSGNPAKDGMWTIAVQAPGWVPSKIRVSSRTQSAVVANVDSPMKNDGTPYAFPLRAFGTARLEVVMIPADRAPKAGATAGAKVEQNPLVEAAERIRDGDLEGAVPYYEKAIAAVPDDPERRVDYAKVLLRLERYEAAEVQARAASDLAPGKPGPHRVLASVYAAKGDNVRAYAEIETERAAAPNDAAVLLLAGHLAEQVGKPDEALAAYEAAVAADPASAGAWMSLGTLYAGRGESEKSEAAYRKVSELDPANAYQTFYSIGAVLMNKSDPTPSDVQKAIEAFRKSVELKPDYGPANKQLVYALLNAGQIDQARAVIESYLAKDPTSADAIELAEILKGLPKPKKK